MEFTWRELGLLEIGLETAISTMLNRFEVEKGNEHLHPARPYEDMYDRLKAWKDKAETAPTDYILVPKE